MNTPTHLPVDSIEYHTLLADLPGLWPEDSDEMKALIQDVLSRGIDEPLIVVEDEEGGYLLVDGRHRLRAAQMADLLEVPVVVREEDEAADIILGTLLHRRHYSKGAMAYLCYPFIKSKLQRGAPRGNQRARKQTPPEADLKGKQTPPQAESALGVCKTLGISYDTYEQARTTVGFFRDSTRYLWSKEVTGTGEAVRLTCRELWEPRLLAGTAGLKAINTACGYITSKDNPIAPPDLGGRGDHLKYIRRAWERNINHHIGSLKTEVERREAGNIIVEGILRLPDDIFEEVATDIQRQRRAREREAGK